jgi:fermentation-respiration switch protein FrsA (DUF1100 family)
MTKFIHFTVAVVFILLLAACGGSQLPATVSPDLGRQKGTMPGISLNQASTDSVTVVSATATELLTVTPTNWSTSSLTASPTSTRTPTGTPTPPHPLTIDYLRQQEYPGGDLTIENELDTGANYRRYYASYQSEGLIIYGLLTIPNGETPPSGWPVIIFNHGYIPPDQYRTTERYVNYVDGFARRGYIVFRSDYRGHDNSDGIARGAYGNPDYTIDVLNAVATLKNYPLADPERIGMWGHSMGGYITLRAMVVSEDVKAGVIWAGVVASYEDLLSRWRRSRPTVTPGGASQPLHWRDALAVEYGSPEENPQFWDSISANAFLTDLSGPLQMHHGTSDASVPVEFSTKLTSQIRDAGGEVELYIYDGDDHNLANNFGAAMLRSIMFFDEQVKGSIE